MPLPLEPLNIDEVAEFVRPVIEEFIDQGECIIINPQDVVVIGDLADGPDGRHAINFPIFYGPTRIQPRRSALEARVDVNDTSTRRVQFWVDYPADGDLPDFRPGYEVVVTHAHRDPVLKNYQYMIQGAINSSMAWQRTIETVSDLERWPNYQYSYLQGTVVDTLGEPVDGAILTIEYLNNGAWMPYMITVLPESEFSVPVMGQTSYRLTFEDEATGANVEVTPTMGVNLDIGQVVLS